METYLKIDRYNILIEYLEKEEEEGDEERKEFIHNMQHELLDFLYKLDKEQEKNYYDSFKY